MFDDEPVYEDKNYAFFEEKEAREFIDETFREKITEEVFAEY